MNQKGFSPLIIILGIILVIGIASGAYYFRKSQSVKPEVLPSSNPMVTSRATLVPSPSLSPASTTISTNLVSKKLNFTARLIDNYKYKLTLQDSTTSKITKQKTIDLSVLGWDVDLPLKGNVFYNSKTEKIVIPLVRKAGGEGGNKPEGTLPDPPFYTAIYVTSFNPGDGLERVYYTKDFESRTAILDEKRNMVYLGATDGLVSEILWGVDLTSGKSKVLTEIKPNISSNENSIYEELVIDSSGDYLNQKILSDTNLKEIASTQINLNTNQITYTYP